jgi:hypothetical protein
VTNGPTGPHMPPELMEALTRLWRIEQHFVFSMTPRDTWIALGVIQFASRNPQLSPTHREVMRGIGEQLQATLVALDDRLAPYLEMGWDPQFDVPRKEQG